MLLFSSFAVLYFVSGRSKLSEQDSASSTSSKVSFDSDNDSIASCRCGGEDCDGSADSSSLLGAVFMYHSHTGFVLEMRVRRRASR